MGEILFLLREVVFKLGGLLFWPLSRTIAPHQHRRLRLLKIIFWCHAGGGGLLLLSFFVLEAVGRGHAFPVMLCLDGLAVVSIAASCTALHVTRETWR